MPPVDLPGIHYDDDSAARIYAALRPVLVQAKLFGATTGDQLAAIGLLAASVIAGSTLKTRPEVAADALRHFIVEASSSSPAAR